MMANHIVFRWLVSFVLIAMAVPSQVHGFGLSSSSTSQQDDDRHDDGGGGGARILPPLILSIYDEHGMIPHNKKRTDNPRIERGQTVQIAIQPIDQDTRIVRVDNITFTAQQMMDGGVEMGRGAGRGRIKAQRAVRNGKADTRFAGLSCWDGELCIVETKLLDKFFTNVMMASTITAQGFVTVSSPGRTRGGGLEVHEVSMTLDLVDEDKEDDLTEQ